MIDELVKEIDRQALALHEIHPLIYEQSEGVLVVYIARPRERDLERYGQVDPWAASWGRHRGTGQTCEMALLELKTLLDRTAQKSIDDEKKRIADAESRLAKMQSVIQKTSPREVK